MDDYDAAVSAILSPISSIFMYCTVDDYDAAVSATLTYLQFFPDSRDMLNNLEYYR